MHVGGGGDTSFRPVFDLLVISSIKVHSWWVLQQCMTQGKTNTNQFHKVVICDDRRDTKVLGVRRGEFVHSTW